MHQRALWLGFKCPSERKHVGGINCRYCRLCCTIFRHNKERENPITEANYSGTSDCCFLAGLSCMVIISTRGAYRGESCLLANEVATWFRMPIATRDSRMTKVTFIQAHQLYNLTRDMGKGERCLPPNDALNGFSGPTLREKRLERMNITPLQTLRNFP